MMVEEQSAQQSAYPLISIFFHPNFSLSVFFCSHNWKKIRSVQHVNKNDPIWSTFAYIDASMHIYMSHMKAQQVHTCTHTPTFIVTCRYFPHSKWQSIHTQTHWRPAVGYSRAEDWLIFSVCERKNNAGTNEWHDIMYITHTMCEMKTLSATTGLAKKLVRSKRHRLQNNK